jgi:hypothetical protein
MSDYLTYQRFKAPVQVTNTVGCTEKALEECEGRWHIRIPADLRKFFLAHNGGYLKPDGYSPKDGFAIVIREMYSVEDSRCSYFPGLLEFGDSVFGDQYAVSCRKPDYGAIYWIDHETCDPDSLSSRLLSLFRWLPLSLATGMEKVAGSFAEVISNMHFSKGDWIEHLLDKSSDEFRAFAEEVAFDFTDEIGTPLISMVASYGSLSDFCFVAEHTASYPADIVCRAVRNTREGAAITDYLLSKGANGEHCYREGDPYPMGYAKMHNLNDILDVLRRHHIPDAPGLM